MTENELLLTLVGWFAQPVITCVVEKAQKYLDANYEFEGAKMIETLIRTLVLCRATAEKAERRIINDPNLTDWLKMLKDAVYAAEDVLDIMEAKSIEEKVQGKSHKRLKVSASSSFSSLKNRFIPDDNHNRLQKVLDKLTAISDDISKFAGLVNMNENDRSNRHEHGSTRETISQPLSEVGLYGREDEQKEILNMILHPESVSREKKGKNYRGPFVLPIVGTGGVGKTALAQAVFNNPGVQHFFQIKEWVHVSSNLNVIMLMRILIQSFGGSLNSDVVMTLQYVSQKLFSVIHGVRFLVVLDDMFEGMEGQWGLIHNILSHGALDSVVLVTTQNKAFAYRIATIHPIELNPLESEIFWELFKSFAFGEWWDIISGQWQNNKDVKSREKEINFEVIGRRIASKLGGLPLAAKIIGEILRRSIDLDEWRRISKSEWWDIPEGRKILPSIGVGYQHLDPCLRQCFSYCSLFPRNSLLDKERLVQIWIAQNFIPHNNSGARKIEDIGREWFDKLVERFFFQPAGDYKGYVMPNLMHDLAVIVSSDECFYLTDESQEIPQGVRHLAIDTKNLDALKRIPKQNHIRSFFYFGYSHVEGVYSTVNDTLSNLDSIRVLDLSYLHMETKEPPSAIQNMPLLRFLDLSSTGIEKLAHSRFDHYHLQALHIQKCQFLELPRAINKLINLRHLNADAETIALISGIGQLTNLQELDEYRVGKTEGHKITELENLRELKGHLRIINCENIESKEDAVQARLSNKEDLHSVELCWSSSQRNSNIDIEIIEGLKPHLDIKDLSIKDYIGSSFPDWMTETGHFLNLQTINLISCTVIQVLPPLGQLPSLKHLVLEKLACVKMIDHCFYGNDQTIFPALKYFKLLYLTSCEGWTIPRAAQFFPHLSTLEIFNNEALREAPLQCFPASLKALKLDGCPNLNSIAESLLRLSSLSLLHIFNCKMGISLNVGHLRLLRDLKLGECPALRTIKDLESLENLECLEIISCPKLLGNDYVKRTLKLYCQRNQNFFVHLKHLEITRCRSITHLQIRYLSLLEDLILRDCPHLVIDIDGDRDQQPFTSLKRLTVIRCLRLFTNSQKVYYNNWFPCLSYLEMDQSFSGALFLGCVDSLRFLHCQNLESGDSMFEHQFERPTALQELTFGSCGFKQLPPSLFRLSSLRKVTLRGCCNLESLPANGMPPFLREIALFECSENLVQRCQPDEGQDWQLISHVPVIRIDERIISRPQSIAGTSGTSGTSSGLETGLVGISKGIIRFLLNDQTGQNTSARTSLGGTVTGTGTCVVLGTTGTGMVQTDVGGMTTNVDAGTTQRGSGDQDGSEDGSEDTEDGTVEFSGKTSSEHTEDVTVEFSGKSFLHL